MAYKDENWNIVSWKQKIVKTLTKGKKVFTFKGKSFYWFEGLEMFEGEAVSEPLNWFVEIDWYNRSLRKGQPRFKGKVEEYKLKEI